MHGVNLCSRRERSVNSQRSLNWTLCKSCIGLDPDRANFVSPIVRDLADMRSAAGLALYADGLAALRAVNSLV